MKLVAENAPFSAFFWLKNAKNMVFLHPQIMDEQKLKTTDKKINIVL